MQYKMVLAKTVVALMVVGLLAGIMSSPALAKNKALYNKGVTMMAQGKEVAKQGVATIRRGQDMYVKIAQEKGFASDVAQGNQKIEAGLSQARQGVSYLNVGQKQYQTSKRKNPKVANTGLEKMMEGGNMVQDALKVIQEGVKMNNDVLRAKNLESQVEAPTRTILKGSESGLTGIKQFLAGQKLVMENK
jgi:uncharacterized phage infection (PIP) family protein YhgE